MTINQLLYVQALEKYGSFKAAARHLKISQPALSLQIQKLEDEIGFKLFYRNVSPIELTENGVSFFSKAIDIINGVKQLKNFATNIRDAYDGRLTVGIIPTLAPFLVPLFVNAVEKDYPHLQLEIKEQLTDKVVKNVRNGDLDVGIISTPISAIGIKHIPLFYEQFYVYTSEGNSGSTEYKLEDINYDKLWLLDEGNCFRDQINNFCDLKSIRKHKSLIYHSHSIDALIRIVDAKGGMTILPELTSLCLNADQEENLRTISGTPKVREISLIVTNNYGKERYIDMLGRYIRKNIPNHMLHRGNSEVVDPNIKIK